MRGLAWALVLALLAACDDMSRQDKAKAQAASEFFADGKVNQAPPEGTVARGDLARERVLRERPPMSLALLQRGRERFAIYCTPCHGLAGDGDGVVVARGFPRPPDLAGARLRAAPDGHLLRVIAEGYGQMYGYAARVEPADRWALVAYIRALQRSRHASLERLQPAQRRTLEVLR